MIPKQQKNCNKKTLHIFLSETFASVGGLEKCDLMLL